MQSKVCVTKFNFPVLSCHARQSCIIYKLDLPVLYKNTGKKTYPAEQIVLMVYCVQQFLPCVTKYIQNQEVKLKNRCRGQNRDLNQNSRGRRRQSRQNNSVTAYKRHKAQVNMWNKADIRAVLLFNETSTVPFPRRLQNAVNISRTNVNLVI